MRIPWRIKIFWTRFWMRRAGLGSLGRIASWLALWFVPPYYGRYQLRHMNHSGFISPTVKLHHELFNFGRHVFLGERVIIYQNAEGGAVTLGDDVCLGDDVIIETGEGGKVTIGDGSRCHFRCQFAAYKAEILIGKNVGIAQGCTFFTHDHGNSPETHADLVTKGPIIIDDNAWIGKGVTVLSGVHIGKGSVVAAGAVVTHAVPDGMIAAGIPARVIKARSETR